MRKKTPLLIIFTLLFFNAFTQSKQVIKVNIENFADSNIFLTSYFGNKVRLVDTAYSESGKFEFSSKNFYPGGIYMVVNNKKKKLFEFIVNKESKITFSTDTSSFVKNMKIKGSKENNVFFEYVKFNENLFKKNKELSSKLKTINKGDKTYDSILLKLDSLNKISIDFKLNIIENKKNLFVSSLLRSMQEVEISDSVLLKNDSSLNYWFYKNHFWDNLDISDSRFLRTPMLDKKVGEYFSRMVAFQPDSVIHEIDVILNVAKNSDETFNYLFWKFIGDYQNPKYMGFDKVFVHLVETYIENSDYEIENASESIRNSLIERAKKIKPLLLGSIGPNLILIDTNGNYTSFNNLSNKYIAIFFWDIECGICKKELNYLNENKDNWNYDVGIYAINVNGDLEKWKSYIKDNNLNWLNVNGTRSVTADFHDLYDIYGTPVIYLLDEKRNIVAKRMGANQLIPIIENLEKNKY
jgi:thiol-disulfide isomerase/thioredoxin